MNFRFLRRASVRAVVVSAMTFGFLGTVATVASASGGNKFYVATTGNNMGNNCSSQSNPCQTISYALQKQAAEDATGTIHVAAGTYDEQITATPANSNVTIKGAGEGTTIIEPPTWDPLERHGHRLRPTRSSTSWTSSQAPPHSTSRS